MGCSGQKGKSIPAFRLHIEEVRAGRDDEANLTGVPVAVLAARDKKVRDWKARHKKKHGKPPTGAQVVAALERFQDKAALELGFSTKAKVTPTAKGKVNKGVPDDGWPF